MNKKAIWIIVVMILPATTAADDSLLQVYLPREVAIKSDLIQLGEIGIIRGVDLAAGKIARISLGRIVVPGQKVVLDRATVLSRLACSGIDTSKVCLSGAEKITVKRQERIIAGQELAQAADAYLTANWSNRSDCVRQVLRTPKDIIVPGPADDVRLQARRTASHSIQQVKVEVAVFNGDKQIAVCQVPFALKYKCQQVVALVDIPAGAAISPENAKIESVIAIYPQSGWKSPYGLVAKRPLRAGSVISPGSIGQVRAPIIVERNQPVVLRIEMPGLMVTANGLAIQKGRAGDCIKVRTQITGPGRIIVARINEDGTLVPVL